MTTNRMITLSELAEVNPHVALRGLSGDMLVSFIPMSDVSESGRWGVRQERRLQEVRVGYTSFAEGDLLFAKITPCMENGKGAHAVGLTNGIGFGRTEFHVLRALAGNNSRFLYHWLQATHTRTRAIAFMGGSAGQQRVQASFFSHFRVPQIDPAEQGQIAVVLDTVDEAIAATEAVIAKLKQVRAGLLHELLTRGLDEHDQLRDPLAHPEQFQDSPIGRIPSAWQVAACQSLCREIIVGIVVKPAQYYVDDGVPVLRSANVQEDGIRMTGLVYISDESNQLLRKSIIRSGDVVTVRTGYPGTSCVVPPHLDGANCVDLIISRPGAEIVPEYFALWINSPFGRDQVLRVQGGLAQQHFNVGELKSLLVAKPACDEQERIMEQLRMLDADIRVEVDIRGKLSVLKSGLMTDLLTGRVRVPENMLEEHP